MIGIPGAGRIKSLLLAVALVAAFGARVTASSWSSPARGSAVEPALPGTPSTLPVAGTPPPAALAARSSHAVVAEAKKGLGSVLSGEKAYYHEWQTFIDVPDTADFHAVIGVDFGGLERRWAFSVHDASVNGFVGEARGRAGTDAAGFIVTLDYTNGQPGVWAVERRK
jgi:hypothetical protein